MPTPTTTRAFLADEEVLVVDPTLEKKIEESHYVTVEKIEMHDEYAYEENKVADREKSMSQNKMDFDIDSGNHSPPKTDKSFKSNEKFFDQ